MNILSRYILKMFTRNSFIMLCGLTAIFMVFDVLSNVGKVTENTENSLLTIWYYMSLRIPIIFVLIVPMATLLGSMVTMHKLVKDREMIAMGAAGFAIYKVARTLVIGAFLLAIIQLSVSEYVASNSATLLRLWADKDYVGSPPDAPEIEKKLWVTGKDYIVHYKTANPDGNELNNLFIARRTKDGLVDEFIRAGRAVYEDPLWKLEGAYGQTLQKTGEPTLIDLHLRPDDFSLRDETFDEIRLSTLLNLISVQDPKSDIYSLWFQRKLAQPLGIILMVIMVAPMGLFMARRYNALLVSFGFIIGGFVFFVGERLLFSLGESGVLLPFLSIWSPLLIFGSMSLWFMLYKQE